MLNFTYCSSQQKEILVSCAFYSQFTKMDVILESFEQLLDPNWIMSKGGLYLVLIILFIETGLFFGFFLPGDPLLFVSGMIIANAGEGAIPFDNEAFNLAFWGVLFILSTILGNIVGYWSGYKFSHFFRGSGDKKRLIKAKHIDSAEAFYQKRGGFAILIARFLPVVRTFVPIVGGIVKMDFKRFMLFNILGAILWVGTITTAGFLLGENQWVQDNLEWTVLGIVAVVTLPVVFKMLVKKKPKIAS